MNKRYALQTFVLSFIGMGIGYTIAIQTGSTHWLTFGGAVVGISLSTMLHKYRTT